MTVDTYINKHGYMLGTVELSWREMLVFLASPTSPLYPGRNLGTALTVKGEVNSTVWITEIKSLALPQRITTYHASITPNVSDGIGADIVRLFCERWNDFLRPGAWNEVQNKIAQKHGKPHLDLRMFMSAFGFTSPAEIDAFKVLLILCCGAEEADIRTHCLKQLTHEEVIEIAYHAISNGMTFDESYRAAQTSAS